MGGMTSRTRKITLENHEPHRAVRVDIVKEDDQNVKSTDEYWMHRLKDLEARHKNMKVIMEQEYRNAQLDMQITTTTNNAPSKLACVTNRNKVVACYKKYPNQPMKCAKEVQAFAACVDAERINSVANCRSMKA